MNLLTGETSDEYFGGDVPAAVRALLQDAARAQADERAVLLWTAQALAPRCLAVYYALTKHHATRRELAQAERAARRGLAEAAQQAGLDDTGAPRVAGTPVDFHGTGPARFWLFTQKALAFLALRSGRPEEARDRLALITRLEPQARIGDDVIARLARGSF
ncbi:MAG: hypothetical protein KIT35_21115 [Piscinibacter sp.]|uniref:hypothetical protein n=1 Tax=Piscinibacter sp. TaxID=1903157 RepID=UPI002589F687|nr:hypothetical protein [Piscinibacter sp.]MCW5666340.1 hypothetical protein [Piscinibacter sp.]